MLNLIVLSLAVLNSFAEIPFVAPKCHILHVINRESAPSMRWAESEVAALLSQRNPECHILTKRVANLNEVPPPNQSAALIVIQSFREFDVSAVRGHLAPGGRLLWLGDGAPRMDAAAARRAFETLDVADATLFTTNDEVHWPERASKRERMTNRQLFWNLVSVPGYIAAWIMVFDVNNWGYVAGYGLVSYAGLRAVGALTDEIHRRYPSRLSLDQILVTSGIDSVGTVALDIGLIAASLHGYGVKAFLTAPSLLIGAAGFMFNRYQQVAKETERLKQAAEAVRTQLNQNQIFRLSGDDVESHRIGATDPKLYDCRAELWSSPEHAE